MTGELEQLETVIRALRSGPILMALLNGSDRLRLAPVNDQSWAADDRLANYYGAAAAATTAQLLELKSTAPLTCRTPI